MLFSHRSDTHLVTLLKQDHEAIEALFKAFQDERDLARRVELVSSVCQALTIHAAVEEEVFYPAAMRALDTEKAALIREAVVEHATLKGLISVLDGSGGRDLMFAAQVKVLHEYVKHHVCEEEKKIFPALEDTDLDLEQLGLQLRSRKQELEKMVSERAMAIPGMVTVLELGPIEPMAGRSAAKRPAARLRKDRRSRAA